MNRTEYQHNVLFTGDSRSLVRASNSSSDSLNRFTQDQTRAQKALTSYNGRVQNTTRLNNTLGRSFATIGFLALAREMLQAADSMTLLEGRMRLVTDGSQDLRNTQAELFRLSIDSRADLEAFSSFYVRLAQRIGTVSEGGLKLSSITELVSKSLVIGGASAKETTASLLQLSQALGSGVLRGDEFRSLSENALGFMKALADGAGVTQDQLRNMSKQGKLTTDFILDALEKSADTIRTEFSSIPITVGQSLTNLRSTVVQNIGDINKEFAITETLADTIGFFTNNLDALGVALQAVVAIKVASFLQSQIDGYNQSKIAIAQETAAIQANNAQRAQAAKVKLTEAEGKLVNLRTTQQATAAEIANTEAKLKNTSALLGGNPALKQRGVLTKQLSSLRKTELKTGALIVAQENKIAAAYTKSTTLSNIHVESLVGKNKANLAATLSTRALATATKGLNAAYALIGGPTGLIFAAGLLLYHFTTRLSENERAMETAKDTAKLYGISLSEVNVELEKTDQTIREIQIDRLSESFDEATTAADITRAKIASLKEELAAGFRDEVNFVGKDDRRVLVRVELDDESRKETEDQLVELYKRLGAQAELADGLVKRLNGSIAAAPISEVSEAITKLRTENKIFLDQTLKIQDAETEKNITLSQGNALLKESDETLGKLGVTRKEIIAVIEKQTEKKKTELTVVEALDKKNNDLNNSIAELTREYEKGGEGTERYKREIEKLTKERDKLNTVDKTAIEKARDLLVKYDANSDSVDRLREKLVKLGLAKGQVTELFREFNVVGARTQAVVDEVVAGLEEQAEILRLTASGGEEAARVYQLMKDAADKAGVSVGELTQEQRESIAAAEGARAAQERLNDGLKDLVDGLIDVGVEGGNLGDFMKDLWKQMVKDFLASGLLSLLQSIPAALNGGKLDFSGFTSGSTLGNVVGAVLGSSNSTGVSGTTGNTSGGLVQSAGESLGLTSTQAQGLVAGAGAALTLYNGLRQIENGNEVGGAISVASGGVNAYNAYQQVTGGNQLSGNFANGIGAAGNILGIYNGIQQGGVTGYGSAAYNAYGLYNTAQSFGLFGAGTNTAALAAQGGAVNAANAGFFTSGAATQAVQATQASSQAVTASSEIAGQAGSQWGQAAGAALGTAVGAYNVYSGIERGGTAGYTQAAGGAATAAAALGYLGPWGAVLGAVVSLLASGRGARGSEQILHEDYLPELLGVNAGSALGVNGATGFSGGNTGIFGANFGIQGSGLTSQFLADGGENGNGGFFTGAQSSLDGFEALLKASGFDTLRNESGVLKVFDADQNVAQIVEIWQAYADGLAEAVPASAVFQTAVENGFIGMGGHAKLFFENFALGFGESAFEARDSLLLIDQRFDELRENGVASTDALFQSISERYGIAVEDAQFFVDQSDVELDRWVQSFTDATGDALGELFEFDKDGYTVFERMGNAAQEQSALISEYFESSVGGLNGILNGVDLGSLNIDVPDLSSIVQSQNPNATVTVAQVPAGEPNVNNTALERQVENLVSVMELQYPVMSQALANAARQT